MIRFAILLLALVFSMAPAGVKGQDADQVYNLEDIEIPEGFEIDDEEFGDEDEIDS